MRGGAVQQFSASQVAPGNVAWSCTAGTITAGGIFTAPNANGQYNVIATRIANDSFGSGGASSQVTVTVTAGVDYAPNISSRGVTKKNVSASEGVRRRRWTVGRSPALRFYELEFLSRPTAEWSAVMTVAEANYPEKETYWTDPFLLQERKFLFDGPVKWSRVSRGVYDYKVSFREVKVYAPGEVIAVSTVFPYVVDYGFEVEEGKEVFTSDADDWSRVARAEEGTFKRRLELSFYGRSAAEFIAAEAFWTYLYPGRAMTFQHAAACGLPNAYLIDSDLSWEYDQHNMVNYKFTVREA